MKAKEEGRETKAYLTVLEDRLIRVETLLPRLSHRGLLVKMAIHED